MLTEQELIAYLEKTLSPAERARVETELDRDPQQRRQLVRQIQLDAALRAALGESEAKERVKQSVLAVMRGETEEAIKQQVLADTTFLSRGSRREEAQSSQPFSILHRLSSFLRRPAGAFSLAAACCAVFFGVWFATRPAPTALALETPTLVALSSGSIVPKAGDTIRTESSASATVKFADGTILHLEPGTEISLQAVSNPPRPGGKQLKLITGSLSADVAKQPDGLPLLIETRHALVTVVGTEFDLSVATNQTALEVTHGLVKMTGAGAAQPVSVAAGEFAVASPQGALQCGRLARNPYRWPFSSASIWNRPLGSDAKFAPVGRPFLDDGPLVDAMRPRHPVMGAPGDPLRGIWVGGERVADVCVSDAQLPRAGSRETVLLFQRGRRHALELSGVTALTNGDLQASAIQRTDLAGPGVSETASAANPFGLSQIGGLIHSKEWEQGIRHALACRVKRERLGGRREFQTPSTVWPATGGDAIVGGDFLSVGTLLAIPPDVDIATKFGTNGAAYELARAMQDYGVYVTGFANAPFILLRSERGISTAEEDALLNQLVPLLQVVDNNSAAAPAGGGTPRRESAPPLPGESK